MQRRNFNICWNAAVLLIMVCLNACGGSDRLANPDLPGGPADPTVEVVLPGGKAPPFPNADFEREHPATVSDFLNTKTGDKVLIRQEPGTEIDGTDLLFLGDSGPTALYGIWRWGRFTSSYPLKALLDFDIEEGGEFYVLRSNYAAGRWDIVGPLPETFANDGRLNYPEEGFLSPEGNTYVAVLVAAGTDMTVHSVSVLSNDDLVPPPVPQNLVATEITPGSVSLDWDDVTGDTSLDGYNVYSGPQAGFQADASGVVKYNATVVADSEFVVSGLVPGTTYHFAVSAVDIVGNESDYSESVEVETVADDIPGPPTGFGADYIGSTTVEFSWTAPTDEDILGYNIYIGDEEDFELEDGIVQPGEPYEFESGIRDDLSPLTHYWARATTLDIYGQESIGSNSIDFTTVANAEPQVDWLNTPNFLEKSVPTLFDPSLTFDPDDDIEELEFSWDFDNDDVPDFESTGPALASWTWHELGNVDISLTVSDAFNTVELVRTLAVNRHFKRYNFGYGVGYYAVIKDVATDPESSRAAVLIANELNEARILYFDGSSWSTIESVPQDSRRVAVSTDGVSVLSVAASESFEIEWSVQRYLGVWITEHSEVISSPSKPVLLDFLVDVTTDNRYSVGLLWYPLNEEVVDMELPVWHERADGTLNAIDLYDPSRSGGDFTAIAMCRDSAGTYIMDNITGQSALNYWHVTDTGFNLEANVQTIDGTPQSVVMDTRPGLAGEIYWAIKNSAGRIYFGDNSGTANAANQYYDAGAGDYRLAGCGPVADNEGMFYWTSSDANGYESLLGYSSASDTLHNFGTAHGFAANGVGEWHSAGSGGVLVAVDERRDGQVIGRSLMDGNVQSTIVLHEPDGDTSVFSKSAPVVFADDSIYSLHQQRYPSVLAGSIIPPENNGKTYFYGNNTYLQPNDACRTMNPDEYMVLTLHPAGHLIVNRMQKWQSTGTESQFIADSGLADICYSPGSTGVMLVYATDGGNSLECSSWGIGGWSAPVTIHSGSSEILRIKLAARADGEYGLVYANEDDELFFEETVSGAWNGQSLIHNGPLNLTTSYLGLDYNPLNRAAVAVEREGGGIWVGLIPDGAGVSWELVEDLDGEVAFSLAVSHGSSPDPLVLYQKGAGFLLDSHLYLNERINGTWTEFGAAPNIDIIGIPLGFGKDSLGNVVITGMDAMAPFRALCVVYYD